MDLKLCQFDSDRPPTRGARIETFPGRFNGGEGGIAPLRGGRGLKLGWIKLQHRQHRSPPYAGGAD